MTRHSAIPHIGVQWLSTTGVGCAYSQTTAAATLHAAHAEAVLAESAEKGKQKQKTTMI